MSYKISTTPSIHHSLDPKASAMTNFMESFYATSDDPAAHEKYATEYFTDDATLIMGGKGAKGFEEILAFRKSLWTSVSSRRHMAVKIFFGGDDDLMLFGIVNYVMKGASAKEVQIDWSARAQFVFDEAGRPKMKYYQVYLMWVSFRMC
ncbi:hypothetical protein BGW36DRAFT_362426 [Talaromyces proteolyticus]|uniref:SnoaL-like domain-containing protein n=1 Tax=Talaromyces proteolyticus TaxID=1131652 RepID=A0AAD4PT91_9EURO|nr:uncharacterized protein BGW36DRAFT_362426 [Talaromyces proteolyticus]KAH8692880.1 hypothetical protein BGW36DRAFT_362426 [Talaromyces proteolyticus]